MMLAALLIDAYASALIIMAERTEDSASRSWGMSRPSSIVIFVGLIP